MLTEIQKQILRISSSIPVFHNTCGKRTTYRQCNCKTCTQPFNNKLKVNING